MILRTLLLAVSLLAAVRALPASLKEAYDSAPAGFGYDKWVVLETGVTYTGGLWVGRTFNRITAEFEGCGLDVRIVGNGAILDLQGGEICLAYANNRLDIDDCVVINGNIRFRGYHDDTVTLMPAGSVRYVTFYKPHDYGVRLHNCGHGILLERNLVVDAVDTGPDFGYLNGYASPNLPTGTSFALDENSAPYQVYENWSYHSDPQANANPVRHFSILCPYG